MTKQEFIDAIHGDKREDTINDMAHCIAVTVDGESALEQIHEWVLNGVETPYNKMTNPELIAEAILIGFCEEE